MSDNVENAGTRSDPELEQELADGEAVKKEIKNWQADQLRA